MNEQLKRKIRIQVLSCRIYIKWSHLYKHDHLSPSKLRINEEILTFSSTIFLKYDDSLFYHNDFVKLRVYFFLSFHRNYSVFRHCSNQSMLQLLKRGAYWPLVLHNSCPILCFIFRLCSASGNIFYRIRAVIYIF